MAGSRHGPKHDEPWPAVTNLPRLGSQRKVPPRRFPWQANNAKIQRTVFLLKICLFHRIHCYYDGQHYTLIYTRPYAQHPARKSLWCSTALKRPMIAHKAIRPFPTQSEPSMSSNKYMEGSEAVSEWLCTGTCGREPSWTEARRTLTDCNELTKVRKEKKLPPRRFPKQANNTKIQRKNLLKNCLVPVFTVTGVDHSKLSSCPWLATNLPYGRDKPANFSLRHACDKFAEREVW